MNEQVAILVTTFLRDPLLYRCIESIRKYYPDIAIYVGDNGRPSDEKRTFCDEHNCTLLELPFDCGVGGTRNEAIKRIPEQVKYLVIMEDDCVFSSETHLETWYKILLKEPKCGIVGGLLKKSERIEQHYEGNHRIEGDVKFAEKVTDPEWHKLGKTRYYFCDLVLNVFMMRLDMWRGGSDVCKDPIQWDEQFKTALEHADFFITVKYSLRNGKAVRRRKAWKVTYTPDTWMYHKHEDFSREYKQFRGRTVGFDLFGKKWGLTYSYSDYNADNPIIYNAEKAKKPTTKVFSELFKEATLTLNKLGIKWWLLSGTLLGAVREGGFIKHDPDIDLGIAPDQEDKWDAIIKAFRKTGFALYKEWVHKDQKMEISLIRFGVKVDLFFHYRKGNSLWFGAFGPDKLGRWGQYMECVARVFPARLYKNLQEIVFQGTACLAPNPADEYLELQYGKNWQTPNKRWQYWRDNKAIDPAFFKSDSTAFIAGVFDGIDVRHIEMLERAKALATKLIVGVYSDNVATDGAGRVKFPYEDRVRVVRALEPVDRVIRLNSTNPARDLQRDGSMPDYYISRSANKTKTTKEFINLFGGKVIEIDEIKTGPRPDRKHRNDKIAIGIKTFFREGNFFKVVEAVKKNFTLPYRLYIADDSEVSRHKDNLYFRLESEGHSIIRLPFDIGLSAGRNAIIKQATEDYILIMDDDIEIRDGTAIERMKAVLDCDARIGLVAGALLYEKTGRPWGDANYSRGLRLRFDRGMLVREPSADPVKEIDGIRYRFADQVVNFFLAKRELFDDVKWDSNFKIQWEHKDFFIELAKTDWKVAVCLDAEAYHLAEDLQDPDWHTYQYHRNHHSIQRFYAKHGIQRVLDRH